MDAIDVGIALGFTALAGGIFAAALYATPSSLNALGGGAAAAGCWDQLNADQYADLVTRVAYPGLSEDERRLTREWTATTWLYDVMDSVKSEPKKEEKTISLKRHKGGPKRPGTRHYTITVPPSKQMASAYPMTDHFKLVYDAVKRNDAKSVLSSNEHFVLRRFMGAALAYARTQERLRPIADMTDIQRWRSRIDVHIDDVASLFCRDPEEIRDDVIEGREEYINGARRKLQRLEVKHPRALQNPNSRVSKRYQQIEQFIDRDAAAIMNAKMRGLASFNYAMDDYAVV